MNKIISTIAGYQDAVFGTGCDEKTIVSAEKELGLSFSEEYREYLTKYAVACFEGRELTGLYCDKRVDVVIVTKEERERNTNIPSDCYVVEQTNYDGIVVWQNMSGEIFYSQYNSALQKKYDSLLDYIINT